MTSAGRLRRTLYRLLALAGGSLVALASGEFALRFRGHEPWRMGQRPNEPVMFERDDVLGWRNKEGVYVYPAYLEGDEPVRVTILPRGWRATGAGDTGGRPELVLVGGSFTQGWAISDDETFAWQLQKLLPDLHVVNLGSGGFGTYQALLSLEEHLRLSEKPEIVLYGFIDHHEVRNVAPAHWMGDLARASRGGQLLFPFCELDSAGNLQRRPPDSYPSWPFKHRSALITDLEAAVTGLRTRRRWRQRKEVTRSLLLEMQDTAVAAGGRFAVVVLHGGEAFADEYIEFMQAAGLDYVDCIYPVRPLPRELRVRGEWHPNAALHLFWADCIAAGLEALHLAAMPGATKLPAHAPPPTQSAGAQR